ncbi:WhiB family transcriptional regulator [Mycolicibacterium brisbanense]|uniref:Gp60 n=1 Tax=Mycolicibacterium brisbanense TaxID=146020 RepID=A0A117I855_9MYCO|nr:WhiB family transcriptional regulator [Mycolicibacterium brisbanense]MCV7158012.1 WhiB family transcriptional regulator [Mycolicibacterium brisbanense]GAS92660.1 Gp60 [Mycolicibacterium brisbanense]
MTHWRDQAACRDMDPELFFPLPSDLAGREAAFQVCDRCPVRVECRAVAQRFGVWGGEYFDPNAGEFPMKRGRPAAPREHGTPRGYYQHVHAKEPVCEACRAGRAASRSTKRQPEGVPA